jgi:flagellar biosynthesis/type III secretory pathway chaperone
MTTVGTSEHPRALIDLLDQQRSIYEQLLRLADRQSEAITAGDPESLLNVLAQRQVLIDQLLQINERVEPYRQAWSDYYGRLSPTLQTEVRGRIDQVQHLLEQIIEQDKQNRQALLRQRQQVMNQLKQVGKGHALHRAYGSRKPTDPRFTDQQG